MLAANCKLCTHLINLGFYNTTGKAAELFQHITKLNVLKVGRGQIVRMIEYLVLRIKIWRFLTSLLLIFSCWRQNPTFFPLKAPPQNSVFSGGRIQFCFEHRLSNLAARISCLYRLRFDHVALPGQYGRSWGQRCRWWMDPCWAHQEFCPDQRRRPVGDLHWRSAASNLSQGCYTRGRGQEEFIQVHLSHLKHVCYASLANSSGIIYHYIFSTL